MKAKGIPKKKFKRKKVESKFKLEISGVLLLALGIITLVSFIFRDSVGIFGRLIVNFLLGMIGLPAYLVPILVIIYSIFLLFNIDREFITKKIVYFSILIVLFSALIQLNDYRLYDYESLGFISKITRFYSSGISLTGGGIVGGVISAPFMLLFQGVGTVILLVALIIADTILLTDNSVTKMASKFFKYIWKRLKSWIKKYYTNISKKKKEAPVKIKITGFEDENTVKQRKKAKIFNFKSNENNSDDIEDNKNPIIDEVASTNLEVFEPKGEVKNTSNNNSENKKIKLTKEETKSIDNTVAAQISDNQNEILNYKKPDVNLLDTNNEKNKNIDSIKNSALVGAKKLEETLASFGIKAKVINVSRGPAVTRYELQPSPGVKVSKIVSLTDDISLNLATTGVRIEAPIPGKAAIGIEVPNKEVTPVYLKEVLQSKEFKRNSSNLAFSVGKNISGENIVGDIAKMPHMLVAGATGSGKSVCINSMIISLLYKATPDEVRLLMIDPKVVELGIYNGIPHLLIPVVTDPKKAAGALNWAVQEMVNRYKLFADKGARDLKGYNAMIEKEGEKPLPQIVIIIDELADLMMVAPNDVEDAICRLAQMARAAGMHLVIATQRPSVDVITGVIKANIPSRIAFSVSSQVDSRTIIDMGGAEKLQGKGDMFYYPVGEPKPVRIKGTFVSDQEVERVVEFIKTQWDASYDEDVIEGINKQTEIPKEDSGDNDELLPKAIELVVEMGQASVSLIQRKFKVGYARAARIIDQMEERGIVGGFEGSKPRQVLITKQQLFEMNMQEHN